MNDKTFEIHQQKTEERWNEAILVEMKFIFSTQFKGFPLSTNID